MFKIMLSSTYLDLKEHRRIALEALQNLQQHLGAMEIFYAKPNKPKDVCISEAESSDIYIGVIAWRYGIIDEETGKSLTRLEYEAAHNKDLPCLIFLIDKEYPFPAKFIDKSDSGSKLADFRKTLKSNHTCSFFTTPQDLALKILRSLQNYLPDFANNKLRRNGYWEKLHDLYISRELKDLAPDFNASYADLKIIEEIENNLKGLENIHDLINNSYDKMEQDLCNLLSKVGYDLQKIRGLPYYENPFIHRDWEVRVLGLSNWTLHIKGSLLQLKVRALEKENVLTPNDAKLSEKLRYAKKQLKEFVERAILVD